MSASCRVSSWQYGWIARFPDGSEYQSAECDSRAEAQRYIDQHNDRERSNNSGARVVYSLRARVLNDPGPWVGGWMDIGGGAA